MSKLIVDALRREASGGKQGRGPKRPLGRPGDKRLDYSVQVRLTPAECRELQRRAEAEMRGVGKYLTTLVLAALRRG